MERTLIVFKPDAVQRGIVGEILSRFEKVGLKIVGMKMLAPTKEHYHHHYETISKMISRRGQEQFEYTLKMVSNGPVIAVVLEGIEAVTLVRKMVGGTDPKVAAPGTIRGDFAHVGLDHVNEHKLGLPNIIHASGDPQEAALEIEHWFQPAELHSYKMADEHYTQPQPE
jgi:nucleoside-diphosphate kinase